MEIKNKSRLKAFLLESSLLIIIPLVFYVIFKMSFSFYRPYLITLNEISARVFGIGIGCVFHLAFLMSGSFEEVTEPIKRRILNFFDDIQVSFTVAVKEYIFALKNDGFEFWGYFAIMVTYAYITFDALREFLAYRGLI